MTVPLLKIEHLEVRYGDLIGVSDVSLEVPEGSVVALLGSNGGGKTTTLNAIAGLIPVHSGSIGFRGHEIGGETAFSIWPTWRRLVGEGRLHGTVFDGFWMHVGDPAAHAAARARLGHG